MSSQPGPPVLRALDVVLGLLVAVAVAALVALELLVAPAFAAMFRDFGAVLPLLTRVALSPWLTPAAALATLGLGAGGLVARARGAGEISAPLAILGAVLGVGVCAFRVYAFYIPMISLAVKTAP